MIVGLLDFLLFLAGAFYFGGDAVNGKIEAGRYYLWGYHSGMKGYIEVSHTIYQYSKWHAYSVLVTWPLMLLGFRISANRKAFGRLKFLFIGVKSRLRSKPLTAQARYCAERANRRRKLAITLISFNNQTKARVSGPETRQ